MKRRFDDYRRLARGLFGVSSLWLGPRDILYVRGTGVLLGLVEEYLRFELDRLQSISIVRTATGKVLNVIYGGVALAFGGGALILLLQASSAGGEIAALYYVFGFPALVVGLVGLVLLGINVALGPTCLFQVQTATRIERIRPLRRLRAARRVLAELVAAVPAAGSGVETDREPAAGARVAESMPGSGS